MANSDIGVIVGTARARSQPDDSDEHPQKRRRRFLGESVVVTGGEGGASAVVVCKVREAELDEMWSFVGRKKHPRWLWEALDRQTGRRLDYAFGRREDRALPQLNPCSSPSEFAAFTPTAGVPIPGI